MAKVSIFNEWDPLEEVIVGRAENAQIPKADKGVFAVDYRELGSPDKIPSGRYPKQCVDEAIEDLEALAEAFQKLGIVVRRPDIFNHSLSFSSPHWSTDGQANYCPRDVLLCVGEMIIETPMTTRARQYETISYRSILTDYLQSGSKWICAPRPLLLDSIYCVPEREWDLALGNDEPVFDAANILHVGRDLLYLVSDTGNRSGAVWLQNTLGSEYRVHICDNIYTESHVDTTLVLVRPGLLVACAARVSEKNLPPLFKNWDVMYVEDVHDIGFTNVSYASKWIGLNFMMINPDLAVVDKNQKVLIQSLEEKGVDVLPLQLRHARTMGGGFHCVTLDVRRKGRLEDYCS